VGGRKTTREEVKRWREGIEKVLLANIDGYFIFEEK